MKFSIRISILQTFAILVILAVIGVSITYYVGSSNIAIDLYTRLARTTADKIIERTVNFIEMPITAKITRMANVCRILIRILNFIIFY